MLKDTKAIAKQKVISPWPHPTLDKVIKAMPTCWNKTNIKEVCTQIWLKECCISRRAESKTGPTNSLKTIQPLTTMLYPPVNHCRDLLQDLEVWSSLGRTDRLNRLQQEEIWGCLRGRSPRKDTIQPKHNSTQAQLFYLKRFRQKSTILPVKTSAKCLQKSIRGKKINLEILI